MSFEKATKHLEKYGLDGNVMELGESSATVELAAKAIGCDCAHIAKTLSFAVDTRTVLIVTAGDAKIDNAKYKAYFGTKAKMLCFDDVERLVGHGVGGVCPFGVNSGVEVYLDECLKRFEYIYPACGSSNSCVKLSINELEKASEYKQWIDVCKLG